MTQLQKRWKAIAVDDEPNALIVLKMLLDKHCPNVELVAMLNDSVDAISAIRTHKPDVIFLDIEMPRLNGFQMLEQLEEEDFQLIFTTAYDRYAVRAFKYSAIDYLLKPIVKEELVAAVAKLEKGALQRRERVNALKGNMQGNYKKEVPEIISLPHSRGYLFQQVNEILYCEAHNTYTTFFFDSKPSVIITKPLGDVEMLLEGGPFYRVHRQYLVNTKKIKELIRSDGGYLVMNNGMELPLSRSRKDDLRNFMGV